jgi:hypothetical protein
MSKCNICPETEHINKRGYCQKCQSHFYRWGTRHLTDILRYKSNLVIRTARMELVDAPSARKKNNVVQFPIKRGTGFSNKPSAKRRAR